MCTVTFLPTGEDNYILTSNRDENAARSPQQITAESKWGINLIFPRDKGAGGTWIAASDRDQVVCVLNGAFDFHDRKPPYRRSRGLMVLDFFEEENAVDFFENYLFEGMEPFTMIIIDRGALFELRWDGEQEYITALVNSKPYIWSSATLYSRPVQEKRVTWFTNWLEENPEYTWEAILDFHKNAGDGDSWNDVVMDRNGLVQIVSTTSIIRTKGQIEMHYFDLVNAKQTAAKVPFQGEVFGTY